MHKTCKSLAEFFENFVVIATQIETFTRTITRLPELRARVTEMSRFEWQKHRKQCQGFASFVHKLKYCRKGFAILPHYDFAVESILCYQKQPLPSSAPLNTLEYPLNNIYQTKASHSLLASYLLSAASCFALLSSTHISPFPLLCMTRLIFYLIRSEAGRLRALAILPPLKLRLLFSPG